MINGRRRFLAGLVLSVPATRGALAVGALPQPPVSRASPPRETAVPVVANGPEFKIHGWNLERDVEDQEAEVRQSWIRIDHAWRAAWR